MDKFKTLKKHIIKNANGSINIEHSKQNYALDIKEHIIQKQSKNERIKIKNEKLIKQNGICTWCGKGDYCPACAQNLPHKGDRCKVQKVNTQDHWHKCCKDGCACCVRGIVHSVCNRMIGVKENSPNMNNDYFNQYPLHVKK